MSSWPARPWGAAWRRRSPRP